MQIKWQGRHITHGDHHTDLEREAALNEFGTQRMPREQAEEMAYAQYRQKQHIEGAAHHLRGLRRSIASGDQEARDKHTALYRLHMKAMGLSPQAVPPQHIHMEASKPVPETAHRFTNHASDVLLAGAPMAKGEREITGIYHLAKSGGDGGGDKGDDSDGSTSQSSSGSSSQSNSSPTPAQSTDKTQTKNTKLKGIGSGHSDAGPQHFANGSLVIYNNQHGDNYIPSNYIGTVRAHHLLKIHGIHVGHKHFYEVVWRSPEGRFVDDFLAQDDLLPYRKSK